MRSSLPLLSLLDRTIIRSELQRARRASTLKRTIVQGARRRNSEQHVRTNNNSFSSLRPVRHRTIIRHASLIRQLHAERTMKQKARQKPVRKAPTPNKSESESESPTGKSDPPLLTEHTKCMRYFWVFMLSCSIVSGSSWVFVATFMRFCASS